MHKIVVTKTEARLVHKTPEMVRDFPEGEIVVVKPIKSFSQGLAWAQKYYPNLAVEVKGAQSS